MCHSWCRYLSYINKHGLKDETEVESLLQEAFETHRLPPQYHHAWKEYYKGTGTAKPTAVKVESTPQARMSLHTAAQGAIPASNRQLKRRPATIDTAALRDEVGRLRSALIYILADQAAFILWQRRVYILNIVVCVHWRKYHCIFWFFVPKNNYWNAPIASILLQLLWVCFVRYERDACNCNLSARTVLGTYTVV